MHALRGHGQHGARAFHQSKTHKTRIRQIHTQRRRTDQALRDGKGRERGGCDVVIVPVEALPPACSMMKPTDSTSQ